MTSDVEKQKNLQDTKRIKFIENKKIKRTKMANIWHFSIIRYEKNSKKTDITMKNARKEKENSRNLV